MMLFRLHMISPLYGLFDKFSGMRFGTHYTDQEGESSKMVAFTPECEEQLK